MGLLQFILLEFLLFACTARKIPFITSFSGKYTASVPHILASMSDLYIPIGPHISLQQKNRQTDPGNLSQIDEYRKWETEHYNSVLEITVSFLGIRKLEPDIYIEFSPTLHLQCRVEKRQQEKKRGPIAIYSSLILIVCNLQECTVRPSSHRKM
jgi:hypothetical protein